MTTARDRIAAHIEAHRLRVEGRGKNIHLACTCDWLGPETGTDIGAHSRHVADIICADGQIAVVELHEQPNNTVGEHTRWETQRGLPNIYTNSGAVEWGARHATPELTRAFAAVLLAAARKAES